MHQVGSVVIGFEVRTIIDARGHVIATSSRPVTSAELEDAVRDVHRAGAPALDWERRTEGSDGSDRDGSRERRRPDSRRPTDREVDAARSSERDLIDWVELNTGAQRQRVAELVAEFGRDRVERTARWLMKLIEEGEEVGDPTALLVSQVIRKG